jgi:MHS family proline/betaine transporter-like MFS transporter
LGELLRTHGMQVLAGSAALAGTACFNGLFFSHLPAYLSAVLRYGPREAVLSQTVGVTTSAVGILFVGWLGERIPPRHLLRAGLAAFLLLAYPFYAAVATRAAGLTTLLALAGLSAGLANGSFAVLLTDLFPTRIRFTGVALVFNIAFTLFSGTAPLIATTLIRETGAVASPAYLMIGCAALALLGTLGLRRYGGHVILRS